jgi:predicted aspartyl protease
MYVGTGIRVCNGERTFGDVALADTGATGIIIDESVAEELKLKSFGEAKIVTLGTVVKCSLADVSNVIIEDAEIGPRRLFVCRFPEEVRERLNLMGFSEKIILGVSAIEDAGYIPNTKKGVLEKVGFLAL